MRAGWADDHPVLTGLAVGFVCLGLFLLATLPIYGYIARRTCSQKAEAMHRAHRWGYFTDCLVSDGRGAFVPIDNYRDTRQEP